MIVEDRTALSLPTGAASLLAELIQDQLGLHFDTTHLDIMLDKLAPLALAQGCHSFLDYYYLLKYEGQKIDEWQRVMDALSVQETYFWRELDQIQALVKVLVPDWFARTRQPLKIWSAACATGEEPFTIAMALAEAGWLQRGAIEIVGSDACVSGLDKARRGIFRERSFRNLPADLRAKYFQPVPHGWCIAPELLVRVRFQRANLVHRDEITPLARAPIIFCRNVFIYFSDQSIRQTVRCFAECMPADGHLFVGASESLLRLTKDFSLEEIGGAFVYRNQVKSGGTLDCSRAV
jgi:chemotaxis protein methyltransferase CheR